MVLILSRKDVERLLDMGELISLVEKVFLQSYRGETVCPKRTIINVEKHNGFMYYMPAYLDESESLAVKIVSQYDENPGRHGLPTIMASILLNDSQTGKPLALMEGAYITALRTGAASGVAAKYLAREDSNIVGVIGTGVQARTQVWAMSKVLKKMVSVKAYDLFPERVDAFAKDVSEKYGLRAGAVRSSRECVEGSDVLVVATTSKTPVFDGNWLKRGTHVSSIGVSGIDGRELDDATVKNAKIVVDTREGALSETGDLIVPIKNGTLREDSIYAELFEIVGGTKPGRTSDAEITCWKAVGLAIEDAAVARLVYDKAVKEGIGKEVDL
jgi:alanine dehydrogenase